MLPRREGLAPLELGSQKTYQRVLKPMLRGPMEVSFPAVGTIFGTSKHLLMELSRGTGAA